MSEGQSETPRASPGLEGDSQGLEHAQPKPDAIETALADALTKAVTAGRFDVVAQLVRELEARRQARAGNVVPFYAKRASRRS